MVPSDEYPINVEKLCDRAAFSLCAIHILTVVAIAYQDHLVGSLKEVLVNYGIWLSPAIIVLLSKRNVAFIIICAAPILVMFVGHTYYLWQSYTNRTGVTWEAEWVWFLSTLIGTISVYILAIWLPIRVAIAVFRIVKRGMQFI